MTTEQRRELVLRFAGRINARDERGLAELMTEDFRFIGYGGETDSGRDRMRDAFREYFERYPEYRIIVSEVLVGGDDAAVLGKVTGSHIRAELEQTGTLAWVARLRDGRVAEWRIYATPAIVEEQ
jgi:uncharacterized protein (TIGR02246 family)